MIAIGVEVETQEKSSEKTHAGHAGIGEKAHKPEERVGKHPQSDEADGVGGAVARSTPKEPATPRAHRVYATTYLSYGDHAHSSCLSSLVAL